MKMVPRYDAFSAYLATSRAAFELADLKIRAPIFTDFSWNGGGEHEAGWDSSIRPGQEGPWHVAQEDDDEDEDEEAHPSPPVSKVVSKQSAQAKGNYAKASSSSGNGKKRSSSASGDHDSDTTDAERIAALTRELRTLSQSFESLNLKEVQATIAAGERRRQCTSISSGPL